MRYGRTLVASQKTRSQVSRNDTINSMVHFGHFNPEWMANFRLEMVKQKILKELRMDKRPPRMDTKRNSIPKPVFNGLLDSMKETVKDQEDEDDYFGKTTEIVIPAEEGKQCLLAKLSPNNFLTPGCWALRNSLLPIRICSFPHPCELQTKTLRFSNALLQLILQLNFRLRWSLLAAIKICGLKILKRKTIT